MKSLFLLLFILVNVSIYSQKRIYPTTITLNNGNTSYCQNTTATQLTITLGTVQCGGNGNAPNVTHTERIFVNTSNSTVGGTEVSSLSNALFATNATYTPPTTNIGILYYYAIVEWDADACVPSGTITSSVVSIEIFGANSTIPFSQGFNGASCGWTTQQVSGTAGSITSISSGTNETTSPFEGAGFIQFNSFSCTAGNSTRLLSPLLTVNADEDIEIKFHWRNSTTATYSDRLDRVVVQWFDGTTWTDIQTFNRPDATLNGWQEKTCQFNTGNNTSIRIGFRFISAYGYNSSLDNVRLEYIQTPLPVELIYFDGVSAPSFNSLKWSTASEHNSDYFKIERSIDGVEWKTIGTKTASGNSNTKIDYSFIDSFDDFVINYYRLVQVDYDGQYKIYGPISLDNTKSFKKVVKYINLLGQEVNTDTKGFIFEVYEDGTMRKIIR
jgi:hypothetical protein